MTRLLVVDDDPDFAEALALLLRRTAGFETLIAFDGETALALARSWWPQIALVDVAMPRMDGWELCGRLKADPETRGIAVMLMSARSGPDWESRAAAAGSEGLVLKPFDPERLASDLHHLLGDANVPLAARYTALCLMLCFCMPLSGCGQRLRYPRQLALDPLPVHAAARHGAPPEARGTLPHDPAAEPGIAPRAAPDTRSMRDSPGPKGGASLPGAKSRRSVGGATQLPRRTPANAAPQDAPRAQSSASKPAGSPAWRPRPDPASRYLSPARIQDQEDQHPPDASEEAATPTIEPPAPAVEAAAPENPPSIDDLRAGVPALLSLDPDTLGTYRVQVSLSKEFAAVLLDLTYDFLEDIRPAEDLRGRGLAPGVYWVRARLVDLLGYQQPFSKPARFVLRPKSAASGRKRAPSLMP